jgi:uncharacterized protein (DUF58 family)
VTAIPIDWSAVHAAAAFRLAVPRQPIAGRVGERLGSGTGSSLEFQEYRPYVPGDDLRHVDWAAYARSESLNIRLYREEVAPRLDLLVDISRSMAVSPDKAAAYGNVAALLACACARTGGDVRIFSAASAEPRSLVRAEDIEQLLVCDAATSVLEAPHLPLRRRSLRVVLSDFLFPHDADVLVPRLGRDGAWVALIQFTHPEEAEPRATGGQRLIDCESQNGLDLVLDETAVRDYTARFNRLRSGLSRAARRIGGPFAYLHAGLPVREAARALAVAGVLEPA